MKISRFYLFAFSLFIFLSFSLIVKADTTIQVTDSDLSSVNDLATLQQISTLKLQELGSSYYDYLITMNPSASSYPYTIFYIYQNKTINLRYISDYFSSFGYPDSNTWRCNIKSDLTIQSCVKNGNALSNARFILYSTYDVKFGTCLDSSYIFSFNNNSYTVNCIQGSTSVPTIYFLNDYFNSESPDNTPLLTSFIDLVIDRLSYVCFFFTSSYIYLSVIVILILYISIILFRRLL